jgi:hypothetical protein
MERGWRWINMRWINIAKGVAAARAVRTSLPVMVLAVLMAVLVVIAAAVAAAVPAAVAAAVIATLGGGAQNARGWYSQTTCEYSGGWWEMPTPMQTLDTLMVLH